MSKTYFMFPLSKNSFERSHVAYTSYKKYKNIVYITPQNVVLLELENVV